MNSPFRRIAQARLRASRPGPLWFRLGFVFTIGHLFPLVVSQYSNLASLTSGPSQIRTCHFLASGSQPTPVTLHSRIHGTWRSGRLTRRESHPLVNRTLPVRTCNTWFANLTQFIDEWILNQFPELNVSAPSQALPLSVACSPQGRTRRPSVL